MADFEINKRIKEVFIYSGLDQEPFAHKISVSKTTVNEVLNQKKGAGMNVILGLLSAFVEVSSEWLIRGKGDMILKESHSNYKQNENLIAEADPVYLTEQKLRIHDLEKENKSLKEDLISLKIENKELIEENAVLRYLQEEKCKKSG